MVNLDQELEALAPPAFGVGAAGRCPRRLREVLTRLFQPADPGHVAGNDDSPDDRAVAAAEGADRAEPEHVVLLQASVLVKPRLPMKNRPEVVFEFGRLLGREQIA